jgi:hypothetical protein
VIPAVLAFLAGVSSLAATPADYLELQDHPLRRFGKTFVVTEQMPLDELAVVKRLPRSSVRVVMKGNMLRDSWVWALNGMNLERAEIVIGPVLNRQHVNQLRLLKGLHVTVDLGGARLTPTLGREIDALGPVKKRFVVRPGFTKSSLDRIAALKNVELLYDARGADLSSEDLSMLGDLLIVKRVLIRSNVPAADLRKIKDLRNVVLVVEVEKDILADETATALSALGVPVVLQVSDTLDDEKYRALFMADSFDLEVTPANPAKIRGRMLDMLKRTDP